MNKKVQLLSSYLQLIFQDFDNPFQNNDYKNGHIYNYKNLFNWNKNSIKKFNINVIQQLGFYQTHDEDFIKVCNDLEKKQNNKSILTLIEFYKQNPFSFSLLQNFYRLSLNGKLIVQEKEELTELLVINLANKSKHIKTLIFQILQNQYNEEKLITTNNLNGKYLLEVLKNLNEQEISIDNQRAINNDLSNLAKLVENNSLNEKQQKILFFFSMGFLFERFNDIKVTTQNVIVQLCKKDSKYFSYLMNIYCNIQRLENMCLQQDNFIDFKAQQIKDQLYNSSSLNLEQYQQFLRKIIVQDKDNLVNNYKIFVDIIQLNIEQKQTRIDKLLQNGINKDQQNFNNDKEQATNRYVNYMNIQNDKNNNSSLIIKVFSNFDNISKLEECDYIITYIKSHMLNQDEKNFLLAIKCLYNMNKKYLQSQKQFILSIDAKNLKDKLFQINLNQLQQIEVEKIRDILVAQLLYFYINQPGKQNIKYVKSKKKFILSFLDQNSNILLQSYYQRMLQHFYYLDCSQNQLQFYNFLCFQNFSGLQFFLKCLQEHTLVLQNKLQNSFNTFDFMLDILQFFQQKNFYQNEDIFIQKSIKKINKISLQIIVSVYSNYPNDDFTNQTDKLILIMQNRIKKLDKTKDMGALLELTLVWSEFEHYKQIFSKYELILQKIFLGLAQQDLNYKSLLKIFQIVENLIQGDNAQDNQNSQKGIYLLNRHHLQLLQGLYKYIQNKISENQKYIPDDNILKILIILFEKCQINSHSSLKDILNMFSMFLNPSKMNKLSENQFFSAQKIQYSDKYISKKILRSYDDSQNFFVNILIPFYSQVDSYDIFKTFSLFLQESSENSKYKDIQNSIQILKDCFEQEKFQIKDDFDYNKIYIILQQISLDTFKKFTIIDIQILIQIMFQFLTFPDMSVRRISLQFFEKFYENFALQRSQDQILSQYIKLNDLIMKKVQQKLSNKNTSEDGQYYVAKLLQVYINFLRDKYENFDQKLVFKMFDLQQLNECNFFQEIQKIKYSSKIKAIYILNQELSKGGLSNSTKKNILLPFIENVLYKNYQKIKKFAGQKNQQNEHFRNFAKITGECIQKLTENFNLQKLIDFIMKNVKQVTYNIDNGFILFKIISNCLDNLKNKSELNDVIHKIHQIKLQSFQKSLKNNNVFESNDIDDTNQQETDNLRQHYKQENIDINILEKNDQEELLEMENIKQNTNVMKNNDPVNKLYKSVLNQIKNLLYKEKDIQVQFQIQMSEIIIKIIKYLPQELFYIEFKKLIMFLSNMMKNKEEKMRKKVTAAFINISKSISPFLFGIILKEIDFHLGTGKIKHYRNYLTWNILQNLYFNQNVIKEFEYQNGSIDLWLPIVVKFIIQETFSEMHEEKEVQQIKNKGKELGAHKAKSLMQIVGKIQSVETGLIFKIIDVLVAQLQNHNNLSFAIKKCNDLFDGLVKGLSENNTLNLARVLKVCFYYLQQQKQYLKFHDKHDDQDINDLDEDIKIDIKSLKTGLNRSAYKIQEGASTGKGYNTNVDDNKESRRNYIARSIIRFNLKFLFTFVNQENFTYNEKDVDDMYKEKISLNEYNNELIQLINCQYDEITLFSLRLIYNMIKKNIDFPYKQQHFFQFLVKVLSRIGHNYTDVINEVFLILQKIFENQIPQITEIEFDILYYSIQEYLYISDSVTGPIIFLEQILKNQIIDTRIYDLINKVLETFFETEKDFFRKKSIEIFLIFIQNYPINQDLLLMYVSSLIKHLKVQNETTKINLLQFLLQIFDKYGLDYFQKYIDIYYLQILTERTNEKELQIQNKFDELLYNMSNKQMNIQKDFLDKYFDYIQKFLQKDNFQINHSGIILLTLQSKCNSKSTLKKVMKNNSLDLVQGIVFKINEQIQIFKEQLKRNIELKNKYQNTPWKDFFDENNEDMNQMQNISDTQQLVISILQFYNIILQENLTSEQITSTLQNIEMFYGHPISEVQQNILIIFDTIISTDKEILLQEEQNLSVIFVHLLDLFKKKYFDLEEYNFIETFKKYVVWISQNHQNFFNITFQVLKKILQISLAKITYNNIIIERILQFLLEIQEELDEDQLVQNDNFVEMVALLQENRQVMQVEDFNEIVSQIYDRQSKNSVFENKYFQTKQKIIEQRQMNKEKQDMLAITNPEEFQKNKILKNKKKILQKKKKNKEEYLKKFN